jgi:hypothetical protein
MVSIEEACAMYARMYEEYTRLYAELCALASIRASWNAADMSLLGTMHRHMTQHAAEVDTAETLVHLRDSQ